MLRLRMLGPLDLRTDDAAPLDDVLRQPKRAALLVRLAAAPSGGFLRRDTLLAMFWPELDTGRARDALNTAIRFLRKALGTECVVSRGDEDLGMAPGCCWTDTTAFEEALAARRYAEAIDLYRGDFLQGLHVGEAPGFEDWSTIERDRLRDLAVAALRELTDAAVAASDGPLALLWARRALALLPYEERVARRLIEVLHGIGDAPGALRVYEEFARRLRAELGAEPSEKTRAAAERVRRGQPPAVLLSSSGGRPTA
jgi:DNA-binding SARP family transcriptional activator